MNKINSNHVLAAVFLLALLMVYKSTSTQSKITAAAEANAKMEQTGRQVRFLKQTWDDATIMKNRIDTLLMQRDFKTYVGKRTRTARSYQVSIPQMPAKVFDALSTKLLNAPVSISKINVVRSNDQNVSLTLEFML